MARSNWYEPEELDYLDDCEAEYLPSAPVVSETNVFSCPACKGTELFVHECELCRGTGMYVLDEEIPF